MIDCDSAIHLGFYETGISSAMYAGLIHDPDNYKEILIRHIQQEEQGNLVLDPERVIVYTYNKHEGLRLNSPSGCGYWTHLKLYLEGNISLCSKDYPGLSEVF